MNELDLFAAALAVVDPTERNAFLDRECAGQPALRDRLQQLLDAHARSNPLLDMPALDRTRTLGEQTRAFATATETEGTIIAGRYKLRQQIGEGGMGTVWMADQTEPVKRKVAVKLIRVERGQSKTILARFEAERQAIALMDHPHIAKLLDAGTTDTGAPFFVMELVKGIPLNDYCDQHRLTIADRLNLFTQICSAVQHAHQKGIIHRDLKPGNILVESHDGKPVPKVIDFGLAKATTGLQLSEQSMFTAFGSVMGTPLYMAPEQASFNAVDVDTRADVYALGVILYEMLTGTTPLTKETMKKAALDEMLRLVREQEAPTPSSRLSSADSLPSVSANRQIEPQKLGRFVKGELDWIVLKALSKDRDRRYETANGFAKDIERFLNHEPVSAGPPSPRYRLQKFVQRNRGQVLAASLVLFVLVAGMAGTTWGLFEAKRQEQEARKQEQFARDETAEKEKARLAEAERVRERDAALKQETERVKERDAANNELTHRLGISNYLFAVAAYYNRDVVQAAERLEKVPPAQRGWEWAFLKRLTRGGIYTLQGHTGSVGSVSFSPDGTQLVTAGDDRTAKVWDARTGTHLFDLKGHSAGVTGVSFSPDGARIVTGSGDQTAKVWNARTGLPLLELKGHTGGIRSVSFSPDGTQLVTAGQDQTAKVWDSRTGTLMIELKGHSGMVNSVSFSLDGARIVTGSGDNVVKVWNARTGASLLDLKGIRTGVYSVGFSPDGTQIVAGGGDWGEAKVWDARTGTLRVDLKGHIGTVYSVSFCPDGTRIVTAGMDKTAKVWDARTGMPLLDLMGHTNAVVSVGFSPDGARIVTGSVDRTAQVWDASTGTPRLDLKGHSGAVSSVSLSMDGTRIVTGCWDKTARVWDAHTGTPLLDLKGHTNSVQSVGFSRDGARIVTGSWDKTAKVWDAHTGTHLFDLKGHKGDVFSVSFSPDGTRIATGGGEHDKPGEGKVWDARTGTLLFDLNGHKGTIDSIGFSPDGTRLVSAGGEHDSAVKPGEAKVWDSRTGTLLFDLKGHTGGVSSVSFSPDGTQIVTGSYDKTAKVWDARTGMPLLDLKGHSQLVYSASFSPDGKRIVTGSHDQTAKIWDARTGTPLLDLKGHSGWVSSVSFSADGTRLVTGSFDKTVKVWDTRIGQELKGNQPLEAEERDYRLVHTRSNHWHYAEGYDAARQANDPFATRFYLDRLIEFSTAANKPDEVKKWQAERAKYPMAKEPAPMPREKK